MKWQLFNAAALATVMLAGAIPAQAKTVKEVVRTGDLDLASEQGAAELTVRVAEAAWRVCDKTFDMQPKAAIDQCASRLAVRYRPAVRKMVLAARAAGSDARAVALGPNIEIDPR